MNTHAFAREIAKLSGHQQRGDAWAKRARMKLIQRAGAVEIQSGRRTVAYRMPDDSVVCIKHRFKTLESATTALDEIGRTFGAHKKPQRAYECPYCHGFHLTSRE